MPYSMPKFDYHFFDTPCIYRGGGQGGKRLPPPVPSLLPPILFVNCLPPPAFFQLTWLQVCCYYYAVLSNYLMTDVTRVLFVDIKKH